jgi:1-piperideine-2-carboxylate/1-pyrroline-2-carboxylate reductase [NAD(P)H]
MRYFAAIIIARSGRRAVLLLPDLTGLYYFFVTLRRMNILDPAQTAQALPYGPLVEALAEAALQLAAGQIRAPERQVVVINESSVLLGMPAIAADISTTKQITVHADNRRHGLPAIQGEVIVFDTESGRRRLLMDGPTTSARRTAGITLLGIRTLLPRRPLSAVIIGTGVQAAAHADALAEFFGIARFWIAGRDMDRTEEFCRRLRTLHPAVEVSAISASSLSSECPQSDVLIALTTAREPVIPEGVAPTTLAIGVGAFRPDMAEFPAALLHARQIVVDDLAGARHEAGDLLRGKVDWQKVMSISDFLGHNARCAPALPVFKTVGQAAWDLAAARVALAQNVLQVR